MDGPYDVILFAGQSNMQGQCEAPTDRRPVEGAIEYRSLAGEWIPLRDPVGENIRPDWTEGFDYGDGSGRNWGASHVLGAPVHGNGTLIPSFCRAYIAGCGRKVAAVSAAKGAAAMKDWLPGSASCGALLRKFSEAAERLGEAASSLGPTAVWLQGESDAIDGRAKAQYKADLSAFGGFLRREAGVRRFGIIRVGRFTGDGRDLEIIAAQDELCREDPFFLMLTREAADLCADPAWMNPEAHGHFNARGLERLGASAGAALAREIRGLTGGRTE